MYFNTCMHVCIYMHYNTCTCNVHTLYMYMQLWCVNTLSKGLWRPSCNCPIKAIGARQSFTHSACMCDIQEMQQSIINLLFPWSVLYCTNLVSIVADVKLLVSEEDGLTLVPLPLQLLTNNTYIQCTCTSNAHIHVHVIYMSLTPDRKVIWDEWGEKKEGETYIINTNQLYAHVHVHVYNHVLLYS